MIYKKSLLPWDYWTPNNKGTVYHVEVSRRSMKLAMPLVAATSDETHLCCAYMFFGGMYRLGVEQESRWGQRM